MEKIRSVPSSSRLIVPPCGPKRLDSIALVEKVRELADS